MIVRGLCFAFPMFCSLLLRDKVRGYPLQRYEPHSGDDGSSFQFLYKIEETAKIRMNANKIEETAKIRMNATCESKRASVESQI
jgi:hypothetical protein